VARRRLATTVLVALGSAVGAAVWRRRSRRRREHVDLYYADGSLVSLEEGSPEADRLLSVARRVLAQAR
jgi:hypothetical protein